MLSKELKDLRQRDRDSYIVDGVSCISVNDLLEFKPEIQAIIKAVDGIKLPQVKKPSDLYAVVKKVQQRSKRIQAGYLLYLVEAGDGALDSLLLAELQDNKSSIWERNV